MIAEPDMSVVKRLRAFQRNLADIGLSSAFWKDAGGWQFVAAASVETVKQAMEEHGRTRAVYFQLSLVRFGPGAAV